MADPTKKAPKWWLIIGIVFFLVGAGGCGLGIAKASSFASAFTSIDDAVPYGDVYTVTGRNGDIAIVFTSTVAADCSVTDGAGTSVRLDDLQTGIDDTTQDGFFAQGVFTESSGETYTVECTGRVNDNGEFSVISLPLSDLIIATGGFLGGGLALFLGVLFVIIGIVRRVSWNKKRKGLAGGGTYPPGGPMGPAGTYPPAGPGSYGTAPPPAPGGYAPPPAPGGYGTAPPPPGPTGQPPVDPWGNPQQG